MRVLPVLLLLPFAHGLMKAHFLKFISQKFGGETAQHLNRADLGPRFAGSFGGGPDEGPTTRRPVVFVHGLRMKAGHLLGQRAIFHRNGWPLNRLIATTYGPGKVDLISSLQETMDCEYVKNIRSLLEATIEYYGSDIDVIGYSMGSPISRKAIMGGYCVDTGEFIGESINHRVVTFLSVAGANHGSYLCKSPSPGFCDAKNGLYCDSDFLNDINGRYRRKKKSRKHRFCRNETIGRHHYTLATNTDEVTGFMTPCGFKSHEFPAATEIVVPNRTHMGLILKAIQDQVVIMRRHA